VQALLSRYIGWADIAPDSGTTGVVHVEGPASYAMACRRLASATARAIQNAKRSNNSATLKLVAAVLTHSFPFFGERRC